MPVKQRHKVLLQVLDLADEEFPDGQSRQLRMARLRIGHSRALARQDVIMARHLGALMAAVSDPSDVVHLNLRYVLSATGKEMCIF